MVPTIQTALPMLSPAAAAAAFGVARGSSEYNITLINKMDAPERCAVPLRDEALYGMGPTSVSWHADSSLEDWSSIAVWQTTSNPPDATDW